MLIERRALNLKMKILGCIFFMSLPLEIFHLKDASANVSQSRHDMVTIPLFLGGCLLLIGPLFYAALFYVPGRPYYPLEAAIYAGTHRMVWGCGIATIIIALSTGNLSWVNFILSNKLFIALGKLTYSAYLVHLPFDLIAVGMIRQSFYLSTFNMISISIADMVYAHAAAILLYLMIECPFRDMAALVFSKRKLANK
ncbi:nose resistant to fluoxetine protein 6-like [Ischnura elegans]|uniref:nose resistant to fluoxetine protein 6-like n=1 Tax=Ischnura elegans TaxID=197161 RepID=UPI001ED88674|nr:nose resistant to fluoxetine protein 6-like [Ischnura elegans]